ncbi:MAG: hypothetical protein QGF59_14450 [Pirellulaceae bacterium]|nr:hypothetical protein [Pirellulaceae bacterium]
MPAPAALSTAPINETAVLYNGLMPGWILPKPLNTSTTPDRYTDIVDRYEPCTKQFTAPGAWAGLYELK